jgi:hypothetical protein
LTFNRLHGVISQKKELFVTTTLVTSDRNYRKWFLDKWDGVVWTGLIWLRIEAGDGLL